MTGGGVTLTTRMRKTTIVAAGEEEGVTGKNTSGPGPDPTSTGGEGAEVWAAAAANGSTRTNTSGLEAHRAQSHHTHQKRASGGTTRGAGTTTTTNVGAALAPTAEGARCPVTIHTTRTETAGATSPVTEAGTG